LKYFKIFGSLLIFACLPAGAADQDVTWSKYSANLRLETFDKDESTAVFIGHTQLHGRLFFEFDDLGNDTYGDILQAVLVPDSKTASTLPYVSSGYYASKIKRIFVNNPDDALVMLVGKEKTHQLTDHGNTKELSFDVEIEIKKFVVTIECDTREYIATAATITQPSMKFVGIIDTNRHGC